MTSLPQRTPLSTLRTSAPVFEDADVRRFVADRHATAYTDFQGRHAEMLALVDRPEAEIILDTDPKDDFREAAGTLERLRRTARYWRYAVALPGMDAYTQLQVARRQAVDVLTAPLDPPHQEQQRLERDVARSFYNNSTDQCLAWWIETGEVLGLVSGL